MSYLLDTNILMRLANASDPAHPVAAHAVVELHRRGELLHITPQVLIEFRSAATRPKSANGAGFSPAEAEAQSSTFESRFPLLPESLAIFPAWKTLVTALGVIGRQVYDARLVAVCHVHGITYLLTFNIADFSRFATIPPGIVVVDPASV